MKSIARTAPNIALVKYWGKADEARVLPLNSSVSLTLGRALQTQTRASLTPGPDSLLINGRPSPITPRAATVIAFFKSQFRENANFEIVSTNLGPTASGMASSASGLSALVLALNGLLQSPLPFDKISELTRLGSGSAIRSLKGGLVEWRAAEAGSTSSGIIQHMKSEDLKDLRVAALVEEVGEKDVKSSAGMKLTMETSLLARQRPKIAEDHVQQVVQAIRGKDYRKLS
jgi:diphosphomevalonate decarboxylase